MVMAADGQVTLGATVMKHSARKIRRLYNDKVLAGFAGSTADAFSLFTRFEAKLEQYGGNLGRSAVELAKDWRTDKLLRQLQALLIVADAKQMFLLSGDGDVIEPDAVGNAELNVNIKPTETNFLIESFQKVANRITTGLILASLIIGAALLMRVETTFRIFGYPGFAILCFTAAAAGAVWLLLNILWQDHKSKRAPRR